MRTSWLMIAAALLGACGDSSPKAKGDADRPAEPASAGAAHDGGASAADGIDRGDSGGIAAEPLLAGRGADPGAPRFRRVPIADSHLDFQNELRNENRYTYLTNGAGLAVGDYDGDGWLDCYLVSQDGPNKLFRQTSPLVFEDVTAKAGGVDGGEAWGTGACFADVDGDGDLDLYVCNMEAPNRLYENRGDGTFVENAAKFGLDICAASTMAAFADYDRDGRLDLYLLTNRALHAGWARTPEVLRGFRPPADTRRKVTEMVPSLEDQRGVDAAAMRGELRGDGDLPQRLREHFLVFRGRRYGAAGQPDRLLRNVGGRFVDVTASAGIADHSMGLSATWWDYDGDGYQDLYVANDLESPDVLYHNQHDGTFRDVTRDVVPHTAYYGMGADFADVDGDGRFDLLVADMSMTTHEKAKVLMGDMTEERPVLMHWDPPQMMRNALLLNTGAARFQEAARLAGVTSTDWTWSVLFGDLDQDGRIDLFVTNGIARFDMDPDLELRVAALWKEGREQAAIELIQNVRKVPEKNLAFRNAGDLQFVKADDWGLDLESVSHGAALADFDQDGDLDVLVNNFNEPASLYENRTTDGKAIVVRLRGQRSERFGTGARVTATLPDGQRLVRELTLARGYLSGQPPELHFGVGQATAVALSVQWPSGTVQQFDDLATDQRYVVTEPDGAPPRAAQTADAAQPTWFVADKAPPFTHRENEFDEYEAQPLLPAAVSRLGPALAVGDAADGPEVFVGGARGQPGAMFRRVADGFRERRGEWLQDGQHEDVGACFCDYDGDGDLDLIVTSGGAEVPAGDPLLQDRVYRNDEGVFARDEAALPELRESSGHAVAADFDGDGDPDLFVAGRLVPGAWPDAPSSRLYRNDGGRFVDATQQLAPMLANAGMVTDALWTDADGDGRLDLLLAAHWQPLRLLRQQADHTFVDATAQAGLAASSGWWNALVAWDVDGDGDLDYVAGNQGLNTKYKASPEHPARLYFGDFDGDGRRDLVEAKYEDERLLPVRGRSCSSQAMPVLAERFPTYQQFARSVLTDIYPAEQLQQNGQLQAFELRSCWLRNDGEGHFTVEPLPRRAQLAPIFAMVVVDDLLVCAENSFAPEPETGHADGGTGLVLRRGGDGLEVVPTAEHGICAGGDHKGVVMLRRAAKTMVLFARNDGPMHMWLKTRAAPK
ncbi:MAG: VCBS repeat-containing protein [Planctomycetes bacterium]|nr:VCBS repeat-containing protein [Planctomycetota bacterium]